MAKPRMDLSAFIGKLLEEQDGDVAGRWEGDVHDHGFDDRYGYERSGSVV